MAREPVSRDVRFWYGNHYLLPIGRVAEAVEAMTWGLELDPLNLLYRHHLAVGLRHAGRLEDAEVELRKVLEIDGNFPLALETLGAICAQQGRFEEALTLTERAYVLHALGESDRRTVCGAAGSFRRHEPRRRVDREASAWRGVRSSRRVGIVSRHGWGIRSGRGIRRARDRRAASAAGQDLAAAHAIQMARSGEKDESAMRWMLSTAVGCVVASLLWSSGLVAGQATKPSERRNILACGSSCRSRITGLTATCWTGSF